MTFPMLTPNHLTSNHPTPRTRPVGWPSDPPAHLPPPPAPLPPPPGAPVPPSAPVPGAPRQRFRNQAAFHVVGAILLAAAAFAAFVAAFLAAFGTSTCGGDVDDPTLVRQLQIAYLVIGLALAAVPGLWAVLARAARFSWVPWAVIAFMCAYTGALLAVGTNEVAFYCLY